VSYADDFPEPLGPEWVRPAAAPCPNCQCCTKRLCETTKAKPVLQQNCAYEGERSLWNQLMPCPCPRVDWTDEQRNGTACVFCAELVDREDRAKTHLIGMNGGLVASCVPCLNTWRASLTAKEA
jgi:hypothetical protein